MRMLNNWTNISMVSSVSAAEATELLHEPDGSDIVAVLKVEPNLQFYVGFISNGKMSLSSTKRSVENGIFGMKLGGDNVSFFVIAEDFDTELILSLEEYSLTNNPDYDSLVVF